MPDAQTPDVLAAKPHFSHGSVEIAYCPADTRAIDVSPLPTSQPPEATSNYGRRALRGFGWLAARTVLGKGVSLAGQILLARLLVPDDFGRVVLAINVCTFANVLLYAGQREILIHRQARLRRWLNPAAWYALACGLMAMLLSWALAPIAAAVFHDRTLIGLIFVYAIASPLLAVSLVPQALLESRLRFRSLALISLFNSSSYAVFAVILAAMGFGPYSMILAAPLSGTVEAILSFSIGRPRILLRPQFRRWRFILGDGVRLLGSRAFSTLISQGDYTALGWLFSKHAVGIYYFAFNFSIQSLALFGQGVEGVLFPTLSKLSDDPRRQRQGFFEALHALAAIAIPLILFQAVMAESILKALFTSLWAEAAPVLQILGVGMALRVVSSPAQSLLKARGEFGILMKLSGAGAAVFLIIVFVTALTSGEANAATRVAFAAGACYAIEGPVTLYLAARAVGGGWRDVWEALAVPVVIGGIAVLAGAYTSSLLPTMPARAWIRLLSAAVVAGVIYLGVLSVFFPRWSDLFRGLARRVRELWTPSSEIGVNPSDRPAVAMPSGVETTRK